ncbi:MAG: VOC family protein [Rhodobacteraceae bacterium]|nr:VOC family protein [Paracoccaceae bacterium]
MTSNRITLISLSVADIARSRAFYETLGWVPEAVLENGVFYAMAGQKMMLYRREKLAKDLGRAPETLGTGAMTLAQNFPTTQETDAAYAAAISAGATGLSVPQKVFWGGYSGVYADPDGHLWEVAMNPFWELDDRGLLA